MKKHGTAARALALTTAAVGLTLATTASANAVTIQDGGAIPGSTIDYYGCKANVHLGLDTDAERGYARAVFDLPTSDDRGRTCQGWFQRSVNGGTWSRIGDVHFDGVSSTAWYYDDGYDGYAARVCVGEITADPSTYICGPAWSVYPTGAPAADAR